MAGRPKLKVDWVMVESLCKIHCSREEIAAACKVNVDTITACIKREFKMTFTEFFQWKSAGGKTSLRRKMWEKAMNGKGDGDMLKHLSKYHLGMNDKIDQSVVIDQKPTELKIIWQAATDKNPEDHFD